MTNRDEKNLMTKKDLEGLIEGICPSGIQEDWDNCGWQVKTPSNPADTVLVALEVTGDVILEAEKAGAQVILTHHPLLFGGMKKITEEDPAGAFVLELIRKNISVYSCHTSFDKLAGGNNDYLGEVLGLKEVRQPGEEPFFRTGRIEPAVTLGTFRRNAAEKLEIDPSFIRLCGSPERMVTKAGWCTGSGASFLEEALAEGCDLFITGDLKYHDAQFAQAKGIAVMDAGHYGTEKIFVPNMARKLEDAAADAGKTLRIVKSAVDINPFSC